MQMGLPEYEKSNMRYEDFQPTKAVRWEHANAIVENQSPTQSSITVPVPFLNLHVRICFQHANISFGIKIKDLFVTQLTHPILSLNYINTPSFSKI
ncbi:hypothetical protein Lalb_Chr16g0388071 [Lupinus albus]|uniref:Uncharacterized protein n=1 Tax=Lupinus albus TaxID=3870 RepID=A0A6A4PA01_LUPAL|nr:hypothetical protein Lalb_Chr16g0388071 [Lupinus albus]